MVNVCQALLCGTFDKSNPEIGVLDLKAHFRAHKYVTETIKLLPEKPDPILFAQVFATVARWAAFILLSRFFLLIGEGIVLEKEILMTDRKWPSNIRWGQSESYRNILTDFHMHSTFSPDASNSLDEMCQHALQIGFKEIAFTEHVEWHPEWQGALDIDAYLAAVQEAKKRDFAPKGLKVYAGIEVGNPHDYPDQATALFLNPNFDLIIASLHWLRGKNIHLAECFTGRDPTDVYVEYFLEIGHVSLL